MTPEQATFLAQQYAQLMQGEFPATCKVLAAVKDDTRNYKPDDKSRSAWELATHLATADMWFLDSVHQRQVRVGPRKGQAGRRAVRRSVADVVAFYEKTFPRSSRRCRRCRRPTWPRTLDFFGMMEMPAVSFLGMANNHSIHHRGQLAAYLRAMGSKVPAIYGGSADEPMQGVYGPPRADAVSRSAAAAADGRDAAEADRGLRRVGGGEVAVVDRAEPRFAVGPAAAADHLVEARWPGPSGLSTGLSL